MPEQYLSSDLKAFVSDQNFVFVVEYNFFKDSPPIYRYGKFLKQKEQRDCAPLIRTKLLVLRYCTRLNEEDN